MNYEIDLYFSLCLKKLKYYKGKLPKICLNFQGRILGFSGSWNPILGVPGPEKGQKSAIHHFLMSPPYCPNGISEVFSAAFIGASNGVKDPMLLFCMCFQNLANRCQLKWIVCQLVQRVMIDFMRLLVFDTC